MLFSTIAKELEGKLTLQYRHLAGDGEILDVDFMENHQGDFNPEVIYFGHASQCPAEGGTPAWAVLAGEEPADRGMGCLGVAGEDLMAAFRCVYQLLGRSRSAERIYMDMLQMLLAGKGLSAVLDEYSRQMEKFLVILDATGKIIAHSDAIIEDALWQAFVSQGYCSYEFMAHINRVSRQTRSPMKGEPLLSYCRENDNYYLSGDVTVHGEWMGYVFMISPSGEFSEQESDMLALLCRAAADDFRRRQERDGVRAYLYGGILGELLGGLDGEGARSRIRTGKLDFPGRMEVWVVRTQYFSGEDYVEKILVPSVMAILPGTPCLRVQNGLALVVDEKAAGRPEVRGEMEALCARQHLKAGASEAYTDPVRFPDYFHQAEKALAIAWKTGWDGWLCQYREVLFEAMLEALPDGTKLEDFCHPALATLRAYDSARGTSLFTTLKTYVQTGFNQNLTAQKLFLHRNTMGYRRQRIEEMCAIALEDPGTRFQLACSFRIHRYLEGDEGP